MSEETKTDTTESTSQETKTYTQEEVDALLQKEGDRRVTEAMKKASKKADKRVEEAKKLAKMDDQQRYEYELKQREDAIASKERDLALAENKAEAAKVLANHGLSADLVSLVVAEDADTMSENINLLDKAFKASVKAEVERRLASKTPKKNLPLDKGITKEEFRKMSLSQQARLKRDNPDLYDQLTR